MTTKMKSWWETDDEGLPNHLIAACGICFGCCFWCFVRSFGSWNGFPLISRGSLDFDSWWVLNVFVACYCFPFFFLFCLCLMFIYLLTLPSLVPLLLFQISFYAYLSSLFLVVFFFVIWNGLVLFLLCIAWLFFFFSLSLSPPSPSRVILLNVFFFFSSSVSPDSGLFCKFLLVIVVVVFLSLFFWYYYCCCLLSWLLCLWTKNVTNQAEG